jgi:hypothetical protein
MKQMHAFVEKNQPHFTVAHIMPGYVFGRNEHALTADQVVIFIILRGAKGMYIGPVIEI